MAEAKKSPQEEPAQETPKPRSLVLSPQRMSLAEYQRREWVATAPEGTTIEDIKNPAFWALMAATMKPYDRIEVRVDDGSFLIEALVLAADRTWAHVHVLEVYELNKSAAQTKTDKYELAFKGPHLKWCIIRLSDQTMVKEGCQSKDEADSWRREHERLVD